MNERKLLLVRQCLIFLGPDLVKASKDVREQFAVLLRAVEVAATPEIESKEDVAKAMMDLITHFRGSGDYIRSLFEDYLSKPQTVNLVKP